MYIVMPVGAMGGLLRESRAHYVRTYDIIGGKFNKKLNSDKGFLIRIMPVPHFSVRKHG